MLKYFKEICVTHVYREGNFVVDLFTNQVIRFDDLNIWEEYSLILEDARNLHHNDDHG